MKIKIILKRLLYILIVVSGFHCRDPYNVILLTNGDGVLVVEGIINGNGRTKITLSRTTRLSDQRIAPERSASIVIEAENSGTVFPLFEITEGIYESGDIAVDPSVKHRLKIQTADSREYATDFKSLIVTPVIDSLSWRQDSSGVDIFSNAQDESGAIQYYKFDYEETWEFHSAYRTLLEFVEVPPDQNNGYRYSLRYLNPVTQSVDTTRFNCYNDRKSSGVNIVSTERLGSNVLLTPVLRHSRSAVELSVLYSILVNQYGISKDGYDFFSRMKKNTEELGSIFDAQPSELSGNVKCITNPDELVIGYVEFTTIESKRLFIDNDNLIDWGFSIENCEAYPQNPIANDVSLFEELVNKGLHPTTVAESTFGGGIKTFNVQKEDCVDCRRLGSNVKPSFWP